MSNSGLYLKHTWQRAMFVSASDWETISWALLAVWSVATSQSRMNSVFRSHEVVVPEVQRSVVLSLEYLVRQEIGTLKPSCWEWHKIFLTQQIKAQD